MGAHFKALNEPVLMTPSKILEKFFPFRLSQPPCVIERNGQETDFPFSVISGQSGNGNPDFLVRLESLGQARSAGTLQMSVGALVEPQLGKTGKPVFRL